MDAAASRVGASVPIYVQLQQKQQREEEARKQKELEESQNGGKGKKRKLMVGGTLEFLKDNIGRNADIETSVKPSANVDDDEDDGDDDEMDETGRPEIVLLDETEELRQLSDDMRRAAFQAQYKIEMDRQVELMKSTGLISEQGGDLDYSHVQQSPSSSRRSITSVSVTDIDEAENESIEWEDGF